MTKDAAEEYSASLAQIGEGWWRQLAWAYQQGIPAAMSLSLREWRDKYYGNVRMPLEARKEAVAELAESGLSGRAIADVLGVTNATVSRDLQPVTNVTVKQSESTKHTKTDVETVTNVTPRTVEIRRCDFRELLGSLSDVDAINTDKPTRRTRWRLMGGGDDGQR